MSATKQQDLVARLAKTDSPHALQKARKISEPWFRAQALAYIARYCDQAPTSVANQAAKAAEACVDTYQQCAVRAWEIAALAERSHTKSAASRLQAVLSKARQIEPPSSRSEALILLLSAAAHINSNAVETVAKMVVRVTDCHSNWRCDRATVNAIGILYRFNPESAAHLSQSVSNAKLRSKCDKIIAAGGSSPRSFFW